MNLFPKVIICRIQTKVVYVEIHISQWELHVDT